MKTGVKGEYQKILQSATLFSSDAHFFFSQKITEVLYEESNYKTYDELPLFLNAETVANVLGIAMSSAYELMKEKDFPALRVGNRLIVPKEKFIAWVEKKTEVSK